MFPVLFNIGPVAVRSFGAFLTLCFLACLFVVWKRSREEGLSEERVIDVFFLATGAFILFGRLGFVFSNWAVFEGDWGRILLLFRYPGLTFSVGLLFGALTAVSVSRLFSLPAMVILDTFFLGIALATPFWFAGCFLDGCMPQNSWLPLVLAGCFATLYALLRFGIGRIRKSPHLYDLSRRPGFVALCYLIFISLSFLISSYVLSGTIPNALILVLVVAVGAFVFRYFEFLKGVQWLSFPVRFLHKLRDIWRSAGRILRRESRS